MPDAPAQTKLRESLSALAMADKIITRRIEQAQTLEARLNERMAQLAAAESSLDAKMSEAEKQFALRPKQLDADLADQRDLLARSTTTACEELSAHASSLAQDLNVAAHSFGVDLAAHLETAQTRAAQMLDSVLRRIESSREQLATLEGGFEQRLRQIMHRTSSRIEAMTEPLRRKLEESLAMHDQQLAHQMDEMRDALDEQIQSLRGELTALDSHIHREADGLLAATRQQVMNEISTIEEETRTWVRPILREISEHRSNAEAQLKTALDSFGHTARSRIEEIRRECEQTIQMTHRRMLPKLTPKSSPKLELTLPTHRSAPSDAA